MRTLLSMKKDHTKKSRLGSLAVTCNLPKAREKSRVQGAIGFGFASHWFEKLA